MLGSKSLEELPINRALSISASIIQVQVSQMALIRDTPQHPG